jgi:hypothetical protein
VSIDSGVTHRKVSTKPDPADGTMIGKTDWNDQHNINAPLVVDPFATDSDPDDLPYGYGNSTARNGLVLIPPPHTSDDVVTTGIDETPRISLYSYQRANVYGFGEVVRSFLLREDAKAMFAWYGPQSLFDGSGDYVAGSWKPWTWIGAHYLSNDGASIHGHWSIEVPDAAGALQTRLEILFADQTTGVIGLDTTKILTNQAHFVVRCSGGQELRLQAAAGTEKAIVFTNDVDAVARRWKIRSNSTAESGGNVGSDFQIARYDDAGTLVDRPISIERVNGRVGILVGPPGLGGQLHVNTAGTTPAVLAKATAVGTASTAVAAVEASGVTKRLLDLRVTGDAVSRLRIDMSASGSPGTIVFGDGTTADANLYRGAADTVKSDDGIWAVGGMVTKAKAGIPSDADLVTGMQQSGAFVLDTTNSRIYFRVGSTWKYAALT